MASECARLGDAPDPVKRLRDHIVRLGDLRSDGRCLVSACDIEAVAAWHRRWAAFLDAIRIQLDHEAGRQAELVLRPAVNASALYRNSATPSKVYETMATGLETASPTTQLQELRELAGHAEVLGSQVATQDVYCVRCFKIQDNPGRITIDAS